MFSALFHKFSNISPSVMQSFVASGQALGSIFFDSTPSFKEIGFAELTFPRASEWQNSWFWATAKYQKIYETQYLV